MGLLFQIQAIINLPLYSDTSLMHQMEFLSKKLLLLRKMMKKKTCKTFRHLRPWHQLERSYKFSQLTKKKEIRG